MASWWDGAPTKVIKKDTLIKGVAEKHLPVYTLTFEIPKGYTGSGRAIPISSIHMDLGDVVKMVIPSYKPKSYSVSALREREGEFDVTFKVYPNGRASGFLDRLKVGDTINTFGISARRKRNSGGEFILLIAYGVGITEVLPVAMSELKRGDTKRVTILWASRTIQDTFWLDHINGLKEAYPERFEMLYLLSRQEDKIVEYSQHKYKCLHGHVTAALLDELINMRLESLNISSNSARFLSVGTKQMIQSTHGLLSDIGFRMPQHELLPKT